MSKVNYESQDKLALIRNQPRYLQVKNLKSPH